MAIGFAVKRWFFDQKIVREMLDGRTAIALVRAGALVRRIAQWSMADRQDPYLHSPPGVPPYAHPAGGKALKKHIYYHYSPQLRTVVVGPVPLGAVGDTPRIQEHGYQGARKIRNRRRRIRKLGGVGEIRLTASTVTRYADSPTARGEVTYQETTTGVVYAHLRTAAQVDRANRLNEQLYGPMWAIKPVSYPARPYMRPALEAARPMIPKFWATSVAATEAA